MADGSNANLTGITGILSNATLQGDSAYEVAVKNGFVGTEAEWLASLKGDQGDQGIQGPVGPTGSTGDTGNGISNISMDSGGYMEILTTDGTNYRFYAKGDKGDTGSKGDTGTGIRSVVLNSDYTLTITLTDDATYTTGSIRGVKGDTGVGISDIALNQDYTLTVTMDDGTSYTTESIRGEKGEKGDKGDKGDTGNDGVSATVEVTSDTDSDYRLTFTDVNGSIETPNLYSDVTASAKQLLSESYTLDQVPYLFRKSPDSDRAMEEIVGGTVGWNQLCNSTSVTVTSGHKYYMVKGGVNSIGASTGTAITGLTSGTDIVTDLTTMFGTTIADYIYSLEQSTAGAGVAKLKEWGFFTEDYYEYCEPILKSVEGLVSKKTVGFNQWDVATEHDSSTFDFNDATLTNKITDSKTQVDLVLQGFKGDTFVTSVTSLVTIASTGKRQFLFTVSEGYDRIRIKHNGSTRDLILGTFTSFLPNTTYCMSMNVKGCNPSVVNGVIISDICINLSDPTRNGQYEPYESHTYSLDSEVVLRGVPKLDSNNNLYFDGDVYPADGQGKRRYAERAYQSGDESLADAITDGTTTVVKLSTPTTFTAQPYHNPQIVGDTEEFVTTGIVPVGHSTKYYQNLRKKIENLPWNFSSLIAPTEVTNKATQNYTVGSYLIMNNTLYKVTSNIANGGTITPNTNVTATTIMAEFMAL